MRSSRIPNRPWHPLLLCLLACAPSPEVAQGSAGHATWNPAATRSPPPSDADVTSIDPTGPSDVDADLPPTPDAEDPPDEAPVVSGRDAGAARDLPPAVVNPGPARTCTLTFQVTTVTFNGSYAPRNVGAIWVSDAGGRFVKSLNVWAAKRIRHLVTWQGASMGSTVDAVTSATASNHGTRTGRWNCTGLDHQPVPDGTYRINAEMTERNGLGRVMTPVTFVKGASAVDLTAPDQSNFKGLRLQVSVP